MQHHLIQIFAKGGVYEPRETVWAFGGAEDQDVAPLEGGRLAAYDRTRLRQGAFLHSLCSLARFWPALVFHSLMAL
jgi:hypothetical protein